MYLSSDTAMVDMLFRHIFEHGLARYYDEYSPLYYGCITMDTSFALLAS